MRSRKAANEEVAEVARRRLDLLGVELSAIRRSLPDQPPGEVANQPPGEVANQPPGPAARQPAPEVVREEPRRTPGLGDGGVDRTPALATPGRHAHRPIGLAGRIGGWVHDRLPPTLQGSVGLTSAHLTVISLLVAAAMAVAAWWVLRADAPGTVVPSAVPPSSTAPATPLVDVPSGTQPGSPTGTPGGVPEPVPGTSPVGGASPGPAAGEIIIDIAGKVRRPGIATLPAGARVADALKSAGGARSGVNLTALNLARVLVDGEQILVGVPAPSGVAAPAASAPVTSSSGSPGQLVNINTADQVALETLPGVGPVTAQAILTWRTENGAFSSVDELLEVSGIGDATLGEMAPFVTI